MKKLTKWLDKTLYIFIVSPWIERMLSEVLEDYYEDVYDHFANPEHGWPLDFGFFASVIAKDVLGIDVGARFYLGLQKRFPGMKLGIERGKGGVIYGSVCPQYVYYIPEIDTIHVSKNNTDVLILGDMVYHDPTYIGELY